MRRKRTRAAAITTTTAAASLDSQLTRACLHPPLPVARRPFASLNAALSAFLEPETLDGDNAYYCEACACKRPALKGTR